MPECAGVVGNRQEMRIGPRIICHKEHFLAFMAISYYDSQPNEYRRFDNRLLY